MAPPARTSIDSISFFDPTTALLNRSPPTDRCRYHLYRCHGSSRVSAAVPQRVIASAILLIVALLLVSPRVSTVEGFANLDIPCEHSGRTPPTRSRILTRALNPTKSTISSTSTSNPICAHAQRLAMKMIDGVDFEEDTTNEKPEIRNTNQKVNGPVINETNSIQIKAISVYLFTTIGLAKLNKIGQYNDDTILLDLGITFLVGATSIIFVKTITRLSIDGILQARDSRKIIHMFSAPLFMIFWPLFSDVWGARLFAAMITFLQAVRLFLAGTKRGGSEGDELTSAISRSGNSKEALGGPFIYTVVLFLTILVFWRDDLSGVIVLSTMAAGDGAADIVGRRLGKNNKWFFNKDKSIAGSSAFFIASTLCSIGIVWWFNFTGVITISSSFLIIAEKFALISALCAMVELLPLGDDNWSVPISAAVLSKILL